MKLINPSIEFLTPILRNEILPQLERIGRTCYKSENKITPGSSSAFVRMLTKRGHHAMLEHASISVKIVCDRGVSHEIVRHRLASYAQESTRYCDYTKDKFNDQLTFIRPDWFKTVPAGEYHLEDNKNISVLYESRHVNHDYVHIKEPFRNIEDPDWGSPEVFFLRHMLWSEKAYKAIRNGGWKPEQARAVLPNALKTEIVVTMNLREWIHFFKMRDSEFAHPQMRQIAKGIHEEFISRLPEIYGE